MNDHSRATYFVLPLISLNKFSFGPPENFIDAYANREGTKLLVRVKDSSKAHPGVHLESPIESFTSTTFVFDIPSQFRNTLKLFWEGKYSRFNAESKKLIRAHSGLSVDREEVARDGSKTTSTDARILSLERDSDVRKYLEEELRVTIDPQSELLSPPKDNEVYKEEVGELV